MSNIPALKAAQYQAQESKRHSAELKKLQDKNYSEFQRINEQKNDDLVKTTKEFEKNVEDEKNSTIRKLNEFRVTYAERKREENERLEKELRDLKKAHQDQVSELKITHEKEIENMGRSHREYLENATRKFDAEKAKVNG